MVHRILHQSYFCQCHIRLRIEHGFVVGLWTLVLLRRLVLLFYVVVSRFSWLFT